MQYQSIRKAIFLKRPNRFIANILIDGREEICHVKNTGRCAELLLPNVTIYVQEHDNPTRKTRFSLIAVEKGERLINLDSQIPNRVVEEWLRGGNLLTGLTYLRPETTYGSSRFDLYAEMGYEKAYIEVKGVTLEEDGVVRFPDAPTERGIKHIEELCRCVQDGCLAYLIFVVQMKGVLWLEPNDRTQKAFGQALRTARDQGVCILAIDCHVTFDSIIAGEFVEVRM